MTGPQIDPASHPDKYLQHERMKIEAGMFGKLFGIGANAKGAMVWTLAALMIVGGGVWTCVDKATCADFWKTAVLPVVTLAVGYIAGEGRGSRRAS
jgi:hypothetical protein